MSRFDRPKALGRQLREVADAWSDRFEDVDSTGVEIFGRLDAVTQCWSSLCRDILAPFGINYAEMKTLGILRTTRPQPRRSPTELRQLVGQTSAGMTRILDKLEELDLVRREPLEIDGRRVDIVLTRRGAHLADRTNHTLMSRQNDVLSTLGVDGIDAMRVALDTLLAGFADARDRDGELDVDENA